MERLDIDFGAGYRWGMVGNTCSIESVSYCQHYGVSCLSFQIHPESLPMSVSSVRLLFVRLS